MMPGAGLDFEVRVCLFCSFANRGLILTLWGLQLLSKTLYTLPHPQRPSRRAQTAAQDDFILKPPLH